ncbi:hypothetical protein P3S67_002961 [Capsicum chacoense]
MANKDIEFVVTDQIGSSGNENLGANEEIRKLRQQMIEMHRAWATGLPPLPFSADNLEYLSSSPPVSHTQFSIFVDTPQHASGLAPGQHYPNTSNIYFLTPQHKATTCSALHIVHVFVAPPPPEAPNFEVYPQVVPSHSAREPALNIFDDQHHTIETIFKSTNPYSYTYIPEFPLNTEKPVITEEQEEMTRKLRSLELSMKDLQELGTKVSHIKICAYLQGFIFLLVLKCQSLRSTMDMEIL